MCHGRGVRTFFGTNREEFQMDCICKKIQSTIHQPAEEKDEEDVVEKTEDPEFRPRPSQKIDYVGWFSFLFSWALVALFIYTCYQCGGCLRPRY